MIFGSGQGPHIAGGHAGQGRGSGHFTTGHRGRGQGGHSPILHGLEHVLMHGGHFGTDVFKTYFDMSGKGGHSVFNMYFVMSGMGGQGGTVAFRTHLLGSGSGHPPGGDGHFGTFVKGSIVVRFPIKNPNNPATSMLTRRYTFWCIATILFHSTKFGTPNIYIMFALNLFVGSYFGHPNISGYHAPHVSPKRLHTI